MESKQIREEFIKFFEGKEHRLVKSSSLVPDADPTLLFTNAGMVQFKNTFLGIQKRDYKRACSTQKCMRVSGKHNDLEEVGRSKSHNTFFEMLGNFSFGDYFKKEAIEFAWEFVVDRIKIPKEKIWVSVFKDDDESFGLWQKIASLDAKRIARLGEKDNFWSMGDTGPCGPCSEIFYDFGSDIGCGKPECAPGCDCPRFMEFWNLVFMQYFDDGKGKRTKLPEVCVDTGMGLERLVRIISGVDSIFDIDLFSSVIKITEDIANVEYNTKSDIVVPFRIIADHIRALTFLISDGVIPSNDGRGYILRRILRRAAKAGKDLGIGDPFLYKLSGYIVDMMKDPYIDLEKNRNFIANLIKGEEERFTSTLDVCLPRVEELLDNLIDKGIKIVPGKDIFTFYDTYGFPIDLLGDMAKDRGMTLDMKGFEEFMTDQKERARKSWKGKSTYNHLYGFKQETPFVGRDEYELKTRLLGIFEPSSEGDIVLPDHNKALPVGRECLILLEKTPFYPEGGGQISDNGIIMGKDWEFEVNDVFYQKENVILHKGIIKHGEIEFSKKMINIDCMNKEGLEKNYEDVFAKIHKNRRRQIARHHTATHLLHHALRFILGDHVKQAGSLVADDRFRFDFTHFKAVSLRELDRIEDIINEHIIANHQVRTDIMKYDEACEKGAMAIFEEKYGDTVRVVSISDISKELCGGTHVHATGDIGYFRILSESSVGANLRRIEAVCGDAAYKHARVEKETLNDLCGLLKSAPDEATKKLESILKELKEIQKALEKSKEAIIKEKLVDFKDNLKHAGECSYIAFQSNDKSPEDLRKLYDVIKSSIKVDIILLASNFENRALVAGFVDKSIADKIRAGDIVRVMAEVVGGKG
ncbi:alanine--tRNA ligase, partial [bacterium]|nr:alanine--tRNA ligase [bacterium]